ncbi:recombination regulator RecX [Alcaligenaceae bacterium CGII-47]|nr:recombination regulator RecX [Alcaligenaceae bacterium CGII-47]
MEPSSPPRGGLSLKARAIAYLSRREHSRVELARKLSAYCDDAAEIEQLLDMLQRGNWQSDARFAEALVQRTSARQGTMRIMQTLRQHGLPDEALDDLRTRLQDSEGVRVRAVWQRKFGALPVDARDYARQYRFLASRGFSSDSVRRLLGARDED